MRYRADDLSQVACRSSSALVMTAESREADCTLATESPVAMRDAKGNPVNEILLMSGAEYPPQVPLLDSHERGSVKHVLGSIRDLKRLTPDGKLDGRVSFSATPEGESALVKYRERHLTDISVGYLVLESVKVKAGESRDFGGKRVSGPATVVTRWRIKEGSVVPIGADPVSRLRNDDPNKGRSTMDPILRKLLERMGLPATASEDDANKFLADNADKLNAIVPPEGDKGEKGEKGGLGVRSVEEITTQILKVVQQDAKRAAEEQAARKRDIDGLCEIARVPVKEEWYTMDKDAVRKAIKEAQEAVRRSPDLGLQVRFSDTQPAERGVDALRYRLVDMALGITGTDQKRREAHLESVPWGNRRADDESRKAAFNEARRNAYDFRNATLLDIAAQCLKMDGYDIRGLGKPEIAQAAMGLGSAQAVGLSARANGWPALSVTASFPQITLDAMNKSMMVGYEEFPSTWEGPMRRGQSVSDFKNINRIRLGDVPSLSVLPDNQPLPQVRVADGKEAYSVIARGADLSLSWQLLVNDDMGVLSRIPQGLGRAAARTVNFVAWAKLTENRTMRDGQAFFLATAAGNRYRSNSTTGAGAPSVSTVQTLTNKMMQMRGENTPENAESDAVLALMPRYIIGPSALRTTILQLVRSTADPAATLSSAVFNPANTLDPVIEPLLDSDSTTRWYLAADPASIDGIEVTFLAGQERPIIRQVEDPLTMALHHTILQTFAAEALEWRGWQRHDGA